MANLDKKDNVKSGNSYKIINNIARLFVAMLILLFFIKSAYVYYTVDILSAPAIYFMTGMLLHWTFVGIFSWYIINILYVYLPEFFKWLFTGKFNTQKIYFHEVIINFIKVCKRNIVI